MSARAIVAGLVIAGLATGAAHADPEEDAGMAVPDKARLLSDRGRQLQRDGKFSDAIEAYKAAYVLAPSPGLLFNLAQVYRLNGNCDDAAWMYRRFLATDPRDDLRALANDHLDKLAACMHGGLRVEPLHPQRSAQAEDSPRGSGAQGFDANGTDPLDERGHGKRSAATFLFIGGGISLAIATVFAIDGHLAANEVADAYASGTRHADLQSLDDRGHRDDTITAVAGITGGALVITGAVLYGLGKRDQAQHLAFEPHREGGLVKVAWRF